MKYNPKINEDVARLPGFGRLHPNTPDAQAQGALQVLFEMQETPSPPLAAWMSVNRQPRPVRTVSCLA